ncbi:MAG: hypothetical protein Q4B88_01370 [Moraxella sp.]|nr:hypothetical protein [Moraxella sp.]
MKNFSILALTLSATVAIAPAFAETTSHYNISNPSNQQADLSFAFDSTENLQATAMTDKEMAETEGAALPQYIAGAAVVGGFYNLGSYAHNVPANQRTLSGYATAFGSGAVGGAVAATPIGAIRAPIIGGGIVLSGGSIANNQMRK